MGYIIAIQALALAVCLYYIGRLWFSRRDERSRADSHADALARRASLVEALKASEASLRDLLHEAAGLLMDERHRSRARSGDARKTDNYGEWAKLRDDVVKRIGGEA